jgi:hypothetical protein
MATSPHGVNKVAEILRLTNELIIEREISKNLSATCDEWSNLVTALREELETDKERTNLSVIEIAHLRKELNELVGE